MTKVDDLSRSLAALDQDSTLIAVIELSLKSWLVAGLVPGVERRPLKKLAAEPEAVRHLLERWRAEALKAGRRIKRVAVALEAGPDCFGPQSAGRSCARPMGLASRPTRRRSCGATSSACA